MYLKSVKSIIIIFCISVFTIFSSCQKKTHPLNGAWKMVSGTYIGPDFDVECSEADRMCYKLISDDYFAVVEVCPANPDSNLFTAVGKYKVTDSTYTEMYEATNVSYKLGTSLTFNFKLEENDNLWVIEMKQEDMELHEVWQRVKKNED